MNRIFIQEYVIFPPLAIHYQHTGAVYQWICEKLQELSGSLCKFDVSSS